MRGAVLSWLTVLSVAGPASTSRADDERVKAEALFRAGRQASAQGDHKAACESYRESFRLESALGTLLNIAVCEEALGELAQAWEHYQSVLPALAADDPRVTLTRDRMAALERRLPRITVVLSEGDRATTRIAVGAVERSASSWDSPLPIDPGEHELRVLAEGRAPRSYRFAIAEGEQRTLAVEPGGPLAAPEVARAASAPSQAIAHVATSQSMLARDTGRGQRTLGWIALTLGGAGLATSAVTLGIVLDRKATVDEHCRAGLCDDTGDAAAKSGRAFSYVSVISLAGGAVATATGLYLLWTAPSELAPVPAALLVDRNLLGAQVRGTF